jgi:Domain of unknown function (DUF4262)
MIPDPKNLEGFNLKDRKFLVTIDKSGWHVLSVPPRVGEDGDVFAYSTGLFLHFKHPEVILCGLDPATSTRIINEIGRQVQSEKTFETGQKYSDMFTSDVNCLFRSAQVARVNRSAGRNGSSKGTTFQCGSASGPVRVGFFLGNRAVTLPS